MWDVWSDFCAQMGFNALLHQYEDPIPILQVFARLLRTGTLAPSKKPIRKRTVESYLRAIGQTHTALGAPDPRQTWSGKTDFRLQRQLAHYQKQDPPPNRVKPLPLQIIRQIMNIALATPTPLHMATADMITIAFFFLLRPGEYTSTPSDSKPFRLKDVQLRIGTRHLNLATATDAQILNATFATLEFTTQKNGRKGEVIGQGLSHDCLLCPVRSIARRVIHLRQHNAPLTTPLASYYSTPTTLKTLSPTHLTTTIKQVVTFLGPTLGLTAKDVSARSLRATGAMALYVGKVDRLTISLIGRWNSDSMMDYLHVQAEPIMRDLSPTMIQYGSYRLHPNDSVPIL